MTLSLSLVFGEWEHVWVIHGTRDLCLPTKFISDVAGIFRAHVPLLVKACMKGSTGSQTISQTRYETHGQCFSFKTSINSVWYYSLTMFVYLAIAGIDGVFLSLDWQQSHNRLLNFLIVSEFVPFVNLLLFMLEVSFDRHFYLFPLVSE